MTAKRRTLRCAIGIAVDESLAIRMDHLVPYFAPDDFGFVVAEAAFGAIVDGSFVEEARYQWQIGEFRWRDVARNLIAADPDSETSQTDVSGWAQRGLKLNSTTAEDQLVEIRTIHRSLKKGYWPMILGRPSLLVEVARAQRLESVADISRWLGISSPWIARLLSDELPKGTD